MTSSNKGKRKKLFLLEISDPPPGFVWGSPEYMPFCYLTGEFRDCLDIIPDVIAKEFPRHGTNFDYRLKRLDKKLDGKKLSVLWDSETGFKIRKEV